jgi:vancomycin resistance protein YoaR
MNPTLTSPSAPRRWRRDAGILFAAAAFALVSVGAFYRHANAGQVYPGVHVGSIHVGGTSPAEALEALSRAGLDPTAPVVLTADGERWELTPEAAGVLFDARATVERAFSVGRNRAAPAALVQALATRFAGATIVPVVSIDANAIDEAIEEVAAAHDRPAVNAGFQMNGTVVEDTAAQNGRALDVVTAARLVEQAAAAGRWPIEIEVPVTTIQAEVSEAGPALVQARSLMSGPIALEADGASWDLPADALAPMLRAERAGNTVELGIDSDTLGDWMAPIIADVEKEPVNARLGFDPDTGQFSVKEPSQPGTSVDVEATGQRILAAAGAATRRIQIAEIERPAELSETTSAADYGIETLVHEETSFFTGSPAARVHNIQLAAQKFDGKLIPPGAVFSFNEAIGDISAEAGYRETKIIMDGTTADGVGGGVCQVSTTLFRSAFWAGLPIAERHAHGYRVAYYEQGGIEPGLDATIYSPSVDLKFQNDTGGWLLIETATNTSRSTLTFRIYGARMEREVSMDVPVVGRSVAAPAGRVEVDPTMAPGTSEKLEYSRSGADVTVIRHISDHAGSRSDEFFSRYRPTGEVIAVGPPLQPDPLMIPPEGFAMPPGGMMVTP